MKQNGLRIQTFISEPFYSVKYFSSVYSNIHII